MSKWWRGKLWKGTPSCCLGCLRCTPYGCRELLSSYIMCFYFNGKWFWVFCVYVVFLTIKAELFSILSRIVNEGFPTPVTHDVTDDDLLIPGYVEPICNLLSYHRKIHTWYIWYYIIYFISYDTFESFPSFNRTCLGSFLQSLHTYRQAHLPLHWESCLHAHAQRLHLLLQPHNAS